MKRTQAATEVVPEAPVPQYPIESVDNALKVLLLLGERRELRLTEVAEYLGVASSTAHRLLAMLQYRGFMRQEPQSKLYRPGPALTAVAFAILRRFDFRETVRPFLERLNEETAETVHLMLLDGATVHFVDAIESPKAVRVASRLGRSMPAHCTASGKAMLASVPTAELHRLYPDEELAQITAHTVRTRSELEAALAQTAERGYAVSYEESEEGVGSVAVAFPPRSTALRLAMNVAVPINRLSKADVRRFASATQACVMDAAALLL